MVRFPAEPDFPAPGAVVMVIVGVTGSSLGSSASVGFTLGPVRISESLYSQVAASSKAFL